MSARAGAEPVTRRHDASGAIVRQGGPGTPFTAGPFPPSVREGESRHAAREEPLAAPAAAALARPPRDRDRATRERGRARWATPAERPEAAGRNSRATRALLGIVERRLAQLHRSREVLLRGEDGEGVDDPHR